MITARRRIDRNVLIALAVGFSLTILLLLGSGYLGIRTLEAVEERGVALLERHRIATRLIDEIQGEEAGLSGLFYALASAGPVDHAALRQRLRSIENDVSKTLQATQEGSDAERWKGAKQAVERFIAEVRQTFSRPGRPPGLYRAHEDLVQEISTLVSSNYQLAIEQDSAEAASQRSQLRQAFALLGVALALAIACAAATVWIAARGLERLDWQALELSRLSAHILDSHEHALRRFSRELHDEFGQSLTAIEANLAAIPRETPEIASRVEDCTLLVKDVMGNVRELSQLLRPSTLDDFGLAPSLQWLADSFAQRTGIAVQQQISFEDRLDGETETHLFRIAQEALTNISRHSGATEARISLAAEGGIVRLIISDNGTGLKKAAGRGLGLAGMRERMRASSGTLEIKSSASGVTVIAEVERKDAGRDKTDSNPVGR